MTSETPRPRLETGIAGLDRILGGGLFRGSVYKVEGPPGAGKTILGNQLCHHQATLGAQGVYLTLLAESHARMIAHLRQMSFFQPQLVGSNVHYMSGFKVLEAEGLAGLLRLLRETLTATRAALLVMDGLAPLASAAREPQEGRKFLHELQTLASATDCSVLLLSNDDGGSALGPHDTLVDGVFELSDEVRMLRPLRHLTVRKFRGAGPVRGKHTLDIGPHGISVLPRIEAQLLRLPEDARLPAGGERVGVRIPGLDEMLRGGLPADSTTMILGPTGTGKTIFGLHFLAAGASLGERGLFLGFYERPYTLLQKGRRIGLDLEGPEQSGLLRFVWHSFGEASIDVVADRLLRLLREQRPKRLFIDGAQGFQQAVDFPGRLRAVLSAIVEELECRHVTTLYTMESAELFEPLRSAPVSGLSAVTHNIIALRHAELHGATRKVLSIIKLRDSDFDPGLRRFEITDRGIVLGPPVDLLQPSGPAPVPEPWRAPRAATGAAPAVEAPYVLIVDDEFGLAELISEVLGDKGYKTAIAINGEQGLALVRERAPDLVLVDLMMPLLTGPDMIRQMRADPGLAHIPVALMTALPEAVPHEDALSDVVLQKPFTPERLFEVVAAKIRRRANADPLP